MEEAEQALEATERGSDDDGTAFLLSSDPFAQAVSYVYMMKGNSVESDPLK